MVAKDKMLKALEFALNHLRNSVLALKSGSEGSFSDGIWHVAAELEYALFLLSLKVGDKHDVSKFRQNPEPKNLQIEDLLAKVEDLLNGAKKEVGSGNLLNAYKNAYLARHNLFRVQEVLAKEKREELRKK